MKNIAFVIWLIGFPLSLDISDWLKGETTKTSKTVTVLLIIITLSVAYLIYEK